MVAAKVLLVEGRGVRERPVSLIALGSRNLTDELSAISIVFDQALLFTKGSNYDFRFSCARSSTAPQADL